MSILDKNVEEISGPLNVVRMEGSINGIKKIIYLFMDQHEPITSQTECTNVFSKDIQNFFAESFEKLNGSGKMYDFFLEIRPREIENVSYGLDYPTIINTREIYIVQVWKLFRKIFVYEPKKNKVSISKYFTNVRLHYMDMRDYIGNVIWYKLIDLANIAVDMWQHSTINPNELDDMIVGLQEANEYFHMMNNIIDLVKSPKKRLSKNFPIVKYLYQGSNQSMNQPTVTRKQNEEFENIYYLVDKTFRSYNHQNVKNEMGKQLNDIQKEMDYLIKQSNKLIIRYDKIANLASKSDKRLTEDIKAHDKYIYGLSNVTIYDLLTEINTSIGDFHDTFMDTFARFMDVYFLRRFLDKDYITNAITYTGAYHSLIYIHILSKVFNFKITHVASSSIKNIAKLNEQVKKLSIPDMFGVFLPPVFSQCSDISHFPKNFD